MKKYYFFSIVLMFACIFTFAQSAEVDHVEGQTSFYAEIGGPGILFSANIDRRFRKSNLGPGARVGLGFVTTNEDQYSGGSLSGRQRSIATLPIQVNYVFGKPNSVHTFEAGVGLTWLSRKLDIFDYYNDERTNLFGSFSFMYRRQPVNGGFSWRIGFSPLIARGYIQPSAGVSLGYNF